MLPVDLGLEEERRSARFMDVDVAVGRNVESQPAARLGALGSDPGPDGLVTEAPLHEGCGYRVLRSGGVDGFSGRELELMRSPLARHGKRPAHPALLVANEEEAVALELLQDRLDAVE